MAICGTCGRDSSQVRTIFHEANGKITSTEDQCPGCKPGSFEPQWRTARGAMGWEAYPTMYKKITAPDGSVGYEAKDELRADTEAKIARRNPDDVANEARAYAERREFAAKAPKQLTQTQIDAAKAYWGPRLRERAARKRAEEEQAWQTTSTE